MTLRQLQEKLNLKFALVRTHKSIFSKVLKIGFKNELHRTDSIFFTHLTAGD